MFSLLIELALQNLLALALYVDNGGVFPPTLSSQEEAECFDRMRNGDVSARNKLIEHNLRLVAHIIKKYYTINTDQDDLISIGTIGLIKAVSTFRDDRNIRFATYASKCIENEILMHFRAKSKTSRDMYIDEPIETDSDGNALSLMDIVADNSSVPDTIDLMIHSQQLYGFIRDVLSPRELEIIKHRYGLYGIYPRTQREVAHMLGISRSYVSRIEKKALETLRKRFESG